MKRLYLFTIFCLSILGAAIIFPEGVMAQSAGGDVQQRSRFIYLAGGDRTF